MIWPGLACILTGSSVLPHRYHMTPVIRHAAEMKCTPCTMHSTRYKTSESVDLGKCHAFSIGGCTSSPDRDLAARIAASHHVKHRVEAVQAGHGGEVLVCLSYVLPSAGAAATTRVRVEVDTTRLLHRTYHEAIDGIHSGFTTCETTQMDMGAQRSARKASGQASMRLRVV